MYKNLFIILLLIPVSVFASLTQADSDESILQCNVVEKNSNETLMSVSFSQPDLVNSESNNSVFYSYGFSNVSEPGMPIVPSVARFIRISLNGGVHIEVESVHFRTEIIDNYSVMDGTNLDAIESDNISDDGFYPRNITEIGDPAILREFRVASVKMNPVQVNRETGEVRIYDRVDFRVVRDESSTENELTEQPLRISQTYLPIYEQFLDWQLDELDDIEVYNGGICVVAPSSLSQNGLTPWTEWKRQKGYDLFFVPANIDPYTLQDNIQDLWNSLERKFDYLVLIGDESFITPLDYWEEHGIWEQGDLGYGTLSGNDHLVDCALSRISIQDNQELEAYVEKVIQYEKYPLIDDTEWYNRFLGGNSQIVYELTQFGMVERTGQNYLEMLNSGLTFSFSSIWGVDTDLLTNYRKYPVFISPQGDLNAPWYQMDASYSETMIRADSCGAIAVFSSEEYPNGLGNEGRINESLNIGAARAIQESSPLTFGDVYLSAVYLYHLISHEGGWRPDYFIRPLLMGFGDASIWLYTEQPRTLDVGVPDTIDTGRKSYSITVSSDSEPISDAWVTLYSSDELIFRTKTDEYGVGILESNINTNGTSILTITAPNAEPYIDTLIVQSSNRIETAITELIDDGSQGTSGNGNGIPEYGETIGVRLLINNRADLIESLNIHPELADGYLDSTWGSIEYTDVQPNTNFIAESILYFSVKNSVPNSTLLLFTLNIQQDDGQFQDTHLLEAIAPLYVLDNIDEDLQPGTTDEIRFTFDNYGGMSGLPGNLHITSDDPWLEVLTNSVPIQSIAPGESQTSNPCLVSISPDAFRGYQVPVTIECEFSDGRIDTLHEGFTIGTISTTDPVGPDLYGYYAYDDIDNTILSPTYDWIEIDPNEDYEYCGDLLNGSILELPFDFVYYGVSFNEITISHSGWLAPGNIDAEWNSVYWIPSPIGPSGMIAPLWGVGTAYVYTCVLEEEEKVIIEWKSQSTDNPNIYQVILDCNSGTENSDSDILFQYKDITLPTPENSQSWQFYPSIGIENFAQNDGLSLRYRLGHRTGTAEINDETAIFISTRITTESGFVSGTISHSNDGSPVEGVTVKSILGGYIDTTDDEGFYRIQVPTGQQYLILTKAGYPDALSDEFHVTEGQEVVQNYQMLRAQIAVNPNELEIEIDENGQVTESVNVTNSGDFDLTYSTNFHMDHPDLIYTDEIGHHLYSIPISGMVDMVQADESILGLYSPWSGNPYLKQFNSEGEELASIPLNSGERYHCLDYMNGIVLLKSEVNIYIGEIQEDEFIILREFPLPVDPINEIIFDAEDQLYIFSDRSLYQYEIDTGAMVLLLSDVGFDGEGNSEDIQYYERFSRIKHQNYSHLFSTILSGTSPFGDYYYSTKFYYFNDSTGERSQIREISTSETPYFFISQKNNGVINHLALYGWDYNEIWFSEFQVDDSWIDFQPEQDVVLEPGNTNSISFTFSPGDLEAGVFETWLTVDNSTVENRVIVPITVYYQVSDVPPTASIPVEWSLKNIYPNPFNPSTNVEFALVENADVKVKLFNIMGQEVALVLDQKMNAGFHRVTVDGTSLASGVYFLEFEAGPIRDVRKIVLLK